MGLLGNRQQALRGLLDDGQSAKSAGSKLTIGAGPREAAAGDAAVTRVCPGNKLSITKKGKAITIEGDVKFAQGRYVGKSDGTYETRDVVENVIPETSQRTWIDAINNAWTGPNGPYSVQTKLKPGSNGLTAYLAPHNGQHAQVGGDTMWLDDQYNPCTPGGGADTTVKHEFGHILGGDHSDGGLMGQFIHGGLKPETLEKILKRCGF